MLYVRENLLPVFEISSQICGWLNLTMMLLCGYGVWMFFLMEAAKPTGTRSAEDLLREKNNRAPLLSAEVSTEVGASFGKIHQASPALQQAGKG